MEFQFNSLARVPEAMKFEGNLAENFKRFKKQFEIFMIATGNNTKTDQVKVAILLNVMGEEAVDIYQNLAIEKEDQDKYDEVIKAFEKYLIPKRNVTYERFVFNNRNQKEGEPFDSFLQEIKNLIKTCEYGDQQEEILKDRIVIGIADKKIQEKLLYFDDLKLQKCVDICRSSEVTKEQLKVLQEQDIVNMVKKHKSYGTRNKQSVTPGKAKITDCRSCGGEHEINNCPAYGKKCSKCGKLNHFRRKCYKNTRQLNQMEQQEDTGGLCVETVKVNSQLRRVDATCWLEVVRVNGMEVRFKVDTGAEVNIIPLRVIEKMGCSKEVKKTNVVLEAFGGFKIKPVGKVELWCETRALLGLDTSMKLGILSKNKVGVITKYIDKDSVVNNNLDLFTGIGKFKNKCTIQIRDNVLPVARPPRRVPNSLKEKLMNHLHKLESDGIIAKENGAVEWASNLVVVEKPDGSLRVCLDPSELNKALKREYWLIPKIEEICTNLRGKSWFTLLDFKDGFYHVELDSASAKLCTFSTPFGYYKFLRLPFGLSIAPEFFQKVNVQNFGDIGGVMIYFDDLLIAASNEEEHDKILNKVLERARELNVKFNKSKLQFKVNEVKYVGHVFSKEGYKIDRSRIESIQNFKNPTNKKELQRLLGMVNYFRSFIPNLSELTAQIREILKKESEFIWGKTQMDTLEKIKKILTETPVLANFNDNKMIEIHTDASKNGLGCCLLQEGRPVSYASRSLTAAEQKYAQIEKEYLAIAFAVKKFHYLIYGRNIKICTDHKPLIAIHSKCINDIVSPKLQRIKLKLIRYNLTLEFVPGKLLHVADMLSRDFLRCNTEDDPTMLEIVHNVHSIINISEEKKRQFQIATEADFELSEIKKFIQLGWPNKINKVQNCVRQYYMLRNDIHIVDNLVFFKNRLIVPTELRQDMIKLLHDEGHFGVTKTRARAKDSLYWGSINEDILKYVKKCKICERYKVSKTKEPMICHPIPNRPFAKIAADICEFGNDNYWVIVDYYSKWLEILKIRNKTAEELIKKFKNCFSTHGIPDEMVSDNMPFNSFSFNEFAIKYGIKVTTSSPRYPKSNGQAESGVKIAKQFLRKGCDLDISLLNYRNTEIVGVGLSPAQLLMGRKLKTKLPVTNISLNPENIVNVYNKLLNKQSNAKKYYDRNCKVGNEFSSGESVTMQRDKVWVPAEINRPANTPRSYIVRDEEGKEYRRNSTHIRRSSNRYEYLPGIECNNNANEKPVETNDKTEIKDTVEPNNVIGNDRPQRQIRLPKRYNDFVL